MDYFSTFAYVIFIKKDNNYYPACTNNGCNKKVSDENRDDGWYCEKCGRTYSEPNYRYIVPVSVADYTDSAWYQCFNEAAETILGCPANDLRQLKVMKILTNFGGVFFFNIEYFYKFLTFFLVCDCIQDENDSAHEAVFERAYFKPYIFRCRAKIENYNVCNNIFGPFFLFFILFLFCFVLFYFCFLYFLCFESF